MLNSVFLYNGPCPNCGSKDNLAHYSDGHTWCWSGCGYTPSKGEKKYEPIIKRKTSGPVSNLPNDYSTDIKQKGLAWLNKYDISYRERIENAIGWSENGIIIGKTSNDPKDLAPLLIFPIYDSEKLIMWQGRYFGENPKLPKYYTKGAKDVLHIIGKGDTIVVVEDILSAIKVGRVTAAIPVFGSTISTELLVRLAKMYPRLAIWLDNDKHEYAQGRVQPAQLLFKEAHAIFTQGDPKEYSTENIKNILTKKNE